MGEPGQPGAAAGRMPVCLPDGSIVYPPTADFKAIGAAAAAADFNGALGRGWKFDPEKADAYLKVLDAEIDRLKGMASDGEPLNQILPMGAEIASQQAAEVMNNSGALCQASVASALVFLTAYAEHVRQVRDAYLRQDEAALEALRGLRKDV